MNITIIGIGLIGGSMAMSLRGFRTHIIGVDTNPEHCKKALQRGIVDEIQPIEKAIKNTSLIILAVPVNAAKEILPAILDNIEEKTIVVDMGSTKKGICRKVEKHPKRQQYVASHPIAGTENSGPEAAFSSLFKGKKTIICEKQLSSPEALKLIIKMYDLLEMEIIYMQAEEHDRHIAYVSHLSHISSFSLGKTVLEIEKDEKNIFNMAGSGFASTARLAKSSPSMWYPIFEQNKESLTKALDSYIENLMQFRNAIAENDKEKLIAMMTKANNIRKVLEGINKTFN